MSRIAWREVRYYLLWVPVLVIWTVKSWSGGAAAVAIGVVGIPLLAVAARYLRLREQRRLQSTIDAYRQQHERASGISPTRRKRDLRAELRYYVPYGVGGLLAVVMAFAAHAGWAVDVGGVVSGLACALLARKRRGLETELRDARSEYHRRLAEPAGEVDDLPGHGPPVAS